MGMLGIAQHQLECVLAWRQFNTCLSLACTKMKVSFILWDRLVWVEGFIYINSK